MKIIPSYALDLFFGFNSTYIVHFKGCLTPIAIGNFIYYRIEEIMSKMTKKQLMHFNEFMETNPLQIHEYNQ